MDNLPKFAKVKIQYLTEMVKDPDLDDNSFRVASLLFLVYADHVTGESYPSLETISAALGRHAKSVKRALCKPALAAYLARTPGTNKGRSSRYRPNKQTLFTVQKRKAKQGKYAPEKTAKGVRYCPEHGTILAKETRHNCPPNKEQEQRKRTAYPSTSLLHLEQTTEEPVFVSNATYPYKQWQERCEKLTGRSLEEVLGTSEKDDAKGLFLTSKWPGPELQDHETFRREMKYLRPFQTYPATQD